MIPHFQEELWVELSRIWEAYSMQDKQCFNTERGNVGCCEETMKTLKSFIL